MPLTWFAQELFSSCVAACVRMVLNGLGDNRDEAQVRQVLGSPRLGVSLAKADAQLSDAGATVAWHTDWNLTDLRDAVRDGHYPIVGVERHLLGYPRAFHAIVVMQVTSTTIEALDPLDGPAPCRYGVAAFSEAWELAGREVLLLETPPVTA
jgi:ABC-type bacteriocin/lantibiotic exporter with double-glycine peptidase domain